MSKPSIHSLHLSVMILFLGTLVGVYIGTIFPKSTPYLTIEGKVTNLYKDTVEIDGGKVSIESAIVPDLTEGKYYRISYLEGKFIANNLDSSIDLKSSPKDDSIIQLTNGSLNLSKHYAPTRDMAIGDGDCIGQSLIIKDRLINVDIIVERLGGPVYFGPLYRIDFENGMVHYVFNPHRFPWHVGKNIAIEVKTLNNQRLPFVNQLCVFEDLIEE